MKERTRLINGMKGDLVRPGVRNFNPKLRQAREHLDAVRTPEGTPLPPSTRANLMRDLERLGLVAAQIKAIEAARLERLKASPKDKPHAMLLLLARVRGIGIETADMLVHEVLSRHLRDRRSVARYAGPTGSPDESGSKRREKGLAKAGSTGAPWHDPIGLATSQSPEGKCIGSMVSGTYVRWPRWDTQDHDRGTRTQASHRPMAFGDDRRRTRWLHSTPSAVTD